MICAQKYLRTSEEYKYEDLIHRKQLFQQFHKISFGHGKKMRH